MSHTCMSHVKLVNESCPTYWWVISHIWIYHVTQGGIVFENTWGSTMGWLRLVGFLKIYVSFAKEPYKRDDILQKRAIMWYGTYEFVTSHEAEVFRLTSLDGRLPPHFTSSPHFTWGGSEAEASHVTCHMSHVTCVRLPPHMWHVTCHVTCEAEASCHLRRKHFKWSEPPRKWGGSLTWGSLDVTWGGSQVTWGGSQVTWSGSQVFRLTSLDVTWGGSQVSLMTPSRASASCDISSEVRRKTSASWGGSRLTWLPPWGGSRLTWLDMSHEAEAREGVMRLMTASLVRVRWGGGCHETSASCESCHTHEWVMSHIWMSLMSHVSGLITHVSCLSSLRLSVSLSLSLCLSVSLCLMSHVSCFISLVSRLSSLSLFFLSFFLIFLRLSWDFRLMWRQVKTLENPPWGGYDEWARSMFNL